MISYPYRFTEAYQILSSFEFSFIWMQSFSYPVYRKKMSLPMDPNLWRKNYLAFCDFYLDQFGCDDFIFVMPICSILRTFLHLKTSPEKPCNSGNTCYGNFDCDQDVDGSDVMLFKADFGRNIVNNPCPLCEAGDWCIY